MKNILLYIAIATCMVACLKDDSEAPNKFIEKQEGRYAIEKWTKTTYTNGDETATESATDIGVAVLNVVNFGFFSEGTFEKNATINSAIFNGVDPNNQCFLTFLWTGDEQRIAFQFGWCNQVYDYTLTLDGYKNKKQTWTYVATDADGTITSKEVFELKKE